MERKRKHIGVTLDVEFIEAGKAAVAAGQSWSFSAWVNEALRRHVELQDDGRHHSAPSSGGIERRPGADG